jgi:hypothetical protein
VWVHLAQGENLRVLALLEERQGETAVSPDQPMKSCGMR